MPRGSFSALRAGSLFFLYAVIRSLRPSSRIFTAAFTSLSIQFPHPQRYIRSSRRSSFFTPAPAAHRARREDPSPLPRLFPLLPAGIRGRHGMHPNCVLPHASPPFRPRPPPFPFCFLPPPPPPSPPPPPPLLASYLSSCFLTFSWASTRFCFP